MATAQPPIQDTLDPIYDRVLSKLAPEPPENHPLHRAWVSSSTSVFRDEWRHERLGLPDGDDDIALSTDELLAVEYPDSAEIIENMVAANGLHATIAAKKVGKTFLAIQKAICVGAGIPFMGRETQQGRVVAIEEEGNRKQFQFRVQTLVRALSELHGYSIRPDVLWLHRKRFDIKTDRGVERLRRVLEEHRPIYMPLGPLSMVGHMENENDNAEMQGLVRTLLALSTEYNVTIDIAHHRNKPSRDRVTSGVGAWFDSSRGASALIGGTDSNTGLDRDPEQPDGKLYQLNRDGASFMAHYRFDPETLLHVPVAAENAPTPRQKVHLTDVRDLVRREGRAVASDVVSKFDVSKTHALSLLAECVVKQWATEHEGSRKTRVFIATPWEDSTDE